VIEQPASTTRDGPSARLVIGIVIAVVAVIFILSNLGTVRLNFLFLHFEFPAFLMFVLLILLGVGLDRLLIWRSGKRRARTLPPPPPS
jgi:uncharacterized integral membrane protein